MRLGTPRIDSLKLAKLHKRKLSFYNAAVACTTTEGTEQIRAEPCERLLGPQKNPDWAL